MESQLPPPIIQTHHDGVEKVYPVFNDTDGFFASHERFKTPADAQQFIDDFPKRYEQQGYYRTGDMRKIDPRDVKLRIVPLDRDEDDE
jgi:hypothetical protein